MKELLIIGGVAAGATAAARARRLNKDIKITILEAGPDVSFANCGLPYYIGGDIKSRSKLILQSPESFKDQYDVKVEINREAIKIDKENRTVETKNSIDGSFKKFTYDRLILAQGGKPFIPPLEGRERDHVFSLWTLSDMDRIKQFIEEKSPKRALVAGGGFIGLEMVEALSKQGIKIDLVDMEAHVMPLLEGEIAGFLHEELEAHSVETHTSCSLTSIEENSATLSNGTVVKADMVLLSIGVRPTLKLAKETGLIIGESGGLKTDEFLQTSDPHIYAAGDMVEINHPVLNKKIRIPLAGPANRQGRIAATNAINSTTDAKMSYKGSLGTSIVRLFDAVTASTGLNMKQAIEAGYKAEAVVIHKENHTSYYPGSSQLTIYLLFDSKKRTILGAQVAGYEGVDKRIDVISTAIAGKLTIDQLSELDLAYAPPFGAANDPINIAAFAAINKLSDYSPSIRASQLDQIPKLQDFIIVDIRDIFSFQKSHIENAINIAPEEVLNQMGKHGKKSSILLYDETGKVSHRVVRQLRNMDFNSSFYVSGGFPSMDRYNRAIGFTNLELPILKIDQKDLEKNQPKVLDNSKDKSEKNDKTKKESTTPLVIDVRTVEEFARGAYPDAVNIPLDSLNQRLSDLGSKDRDITLYCASGARSAYAVRILSELGFNNLTNGGGLMKMMNR